MKTFSALLISILAVATFSAYAPTENEIKFYRNLEEAKKIAKEENKMIFMDAYASWCGPCKMMDKRVFSNSEVSEFFNENFVSVKIDMDKDVRLRNAFKVRAYPTLFFLDSDGMVISKKVGYHDAKDFLKLGQKAVENAN